MNSKGYTTKIENCQILRNFQMTDGTLSAILVRYAVKD